MPYYWLENHQSTAATSISSNVWYQNCQQSGAPIVVVSENATGPVYSVIVTQGTMFIPTGSGALYYHDIPTTVSVSVPADRMLRLHPSMVAPPYPYPLAPPRPRLARPALLRGRRALRRSIDLFRMLRPEEEIRTFLAGDPLIIHGRRFDYRVQKRDNLLHHTMHPHSAHIPYKLQLLNKSGSYLAQGCTIISDTPVIDQLLALILHIEHDEMVVLNNTNWNPPLRMADMLPQAA